MVVNPSPELIPSAPLPFTLPVEEQHTDLETIISQRYLRPAIAWLLGQSAETDELSYDNGRVMAIVVSNCWYGLGMCVEAFINAQSMAVFGAEEKIALGRYATDFANLLLNRQRSEDNSWDGVLWDTSVITRSLALLLAFARAGRLQISIDGGFAKRIEKGIAGAVRWVLGQSLNRDQVRYAFGFEDLAQAVRLFCTLRLLGYSNFPAEFERDHVKSYDDVIEQLVEYMIDSQVKQTADIEELQFVPWDAPFTGAHALIAFSESLPALRPELRLRAEMAILQTIKAAEASHEGGRWGMPNETVWMLDGYIVAHHALQEQTNAFQLRPDVVFRTLRYLCDEKQRFRDGSLVHVTDYTFCFVMALESVLASRPMRGLLRLTIPQLYDFILWNEQTQSGTQRVAQIRMAELYLQEKRLRMSGMRTLNTYVNILRALGIALIVLASLGVAILLNWIGKLFVDPGVTISYATAVGTVSYVFWIVTRRFLTEVNDRDAISAVKGARK